MTAFIVAHLKSGRFTTHVELTVNTNDEEGYEHGSFVTAVYSLD